MPRLDLAFGPPAHRGVTTLMSVGADDPATPTAVGTPLDDYTRKGIWVAGAVAAAGVVFGSGLLRNVGLGGAAALLGARWLASKAP